jgi:hypothetical protein
MKMWKKYIEKTNSIEPLLKTYLELRRLFQSYDWSESDLEKPPFYSKEMMQLRDGIGDGILKIKQELDDLGLDFREQEFHDYIRPFLTKINELTPLKYGNNKRRNQGDEDN